MTSVRWLKAFFITFSSLFILVGCMGNPADMGGFTGNRPTTPAPCSAKDPNAANNPACTPTSEPTIPVVSQFSISAGSHQASSASARILARTAGSFVDSGVIASGNFTIRQGIHRETFDNDGE